MEAAKSPLRPSVRDWNQLKLGNPKGEETTTVKLNTHGHCITNVPKSLVQQGSRAVTSAIQDGAVAARNRAEAARGRAENGERNAEKLSVKADGLSVAADGLSTKADGLSAKTAALRAKLAAAKAAQV